MSSTWLTAVACLISTLVICSGCQQKENKERAGMDLNRIVFLSEAEGAKPDCLVLPARNDTESVSSLYRSYLLGIRVVSVEADGKPILPKPFGGCITSVDSRRFNIGAGQSFAYTVRLFDNMLLTCAQMPPDTDTGLLDYVKYVIPPFSRLTVRYAVRDGTPDGTLYEGSATFANRVLDSSALVSPETSVVPPDNFIRP